MWRRLFSSLFFLMFSFFKFKSSRTSPRQDAEVPPGTTLGSRLGPRLAQGCHAPTLRIALGCHGWYPSVWCRRENMRKNRQTSCACLACIPQQPQPRKTRFRCRLMVLDFHFNIIISVCRTLTRRQQDLCVPRLVSKRPGEQQEHMCVLFNMALRIRRGTTRPLESLLSNPDSEVSALSLGLAKVYFQQVAVHEMR